MLETRTLNLTLDFCLRVGEVLLSSGAGAADVTATMRALSWELGVRGAEIDVTFTSLSMSYQVDPEEPTVIQVRSVKQRDIDYEDLTLVDHLVRDIVSGHVGLADARSRLARIVSSGHHQPRWAVSLGWGVMCGGVGLMLGGDVWVIAIAFVAAIAIDRMQLVMSRRRLPYFYQQAAGGALATLLAAAAGATPLDLNVSVVVTANIIMLLAGVGFMGGLQDALTGFYLTAGARLTEAMLATAGIIAGVSFGLTAAEVVGVRITSLEPGVGDSLRGVSLTGLGAAITAAAFAFSSYAPRRIIAPIGLIAGVAMVISSSSTILGLGSTWPKGIAAFGIGLVSFTVAGRVRVPPLVVVVSAIVPMLPGLSIYRGLSLLTEGGPYVSLGLLSLITAASVALSLAAGVILGEYVAQPLKREAARLESRLAGPRLVGPLRPRTDRAKRGASSRRKARRDQTPRP
jgi:uncharacterized membrane protein YjjP (DUF1212 family)